MNALIVDDEPMARRRLKRLLATADVEVVGEAENGFEAVDRIHDLDPDVVFLDVRMPGADGLDVIRQVGPQQMPWVVFVTAFDDYAVAAFELSAVDYLLKPFDEQRLGQSLERLRSLDRHHARLPRRLEGVLQQLAAGSSAGSGQKRAASAERLLIKDDDSVYFIETRDIDWIEADGNYVRIHAGADTHLVRRKISDLAEQLDSNAFLRVHRSSIVAFSAIERLVPWFSGGYLVRLNSGEELKLSRGYASKLFDRIGEDL